MSGPNVEADLDVLLLGGRVVLRADAREVVYTSKHPAAASLVAALAVSVPDGLPSSSLEYADNEKARQAVWKQVERVNDDVLKVTGIEGVIVVRQGHHGGYRLRVHPERVDALRFLAASDADQISHDEAKAAIELWGGGPMAFRDGWLTGAVARLYTAHVKLTQLSVDPRRVLIVDDQIAHTLAELLIAAGVDCTPVRSPEEFQQYLPDLNQFALLLVDINLTPDGDYADQLGLKIADDVVNAGRKVPMLGMTYRLAPSADDLLAHSQAMIDRGLAGVILKGSDDPARPDGHERVVNRVIEMLDADPPGASSVKAINERLRDWEERAVEIQSVRSAAGDAKALAAAMAGLRAMTASPDSDLGVLREAVRDFRRVFLREVR